MKGLIGSGSYQRKLWKAPTWGAVACLATVLLGDAATVWAQRPPTDRHVAELAAYLDHVQIAEPVTYRHLAVYPILLEGDAKLRGRWLTLDAAIARGVLVITEKGGGATVPVVVAENRSRDEHVLLMTGEIISGGQQTRTVRHDVVLAPGQRVELSVFCVEAHRWAGGKDFTAGRAILPQSTQEELRRGADQQRIWAGVGEMGRALKAENPTASLELMLKSPGVQDKLGDVRRTIVPRIPDGAVGFIFVERGRAVGAELLGSEALARDLFPKLLDSYAVDYVILRKDAAAGEARPDHRVAIEYYERVCRAGSDRATTPGSGAGIRTRAGGLLGDGVSLDGTLVHYGVQAEQRIIRPPPPPIIYPRPR